MTKKPRVLGFIPARAGSKGLPDKNIKLLCGRPLISWSIDCALKSSFIDDVVVSTDCRGIANISQAAGAEVPFIRPPYLAEDNSQTIDVILHALNFLEQVGRAYDYVVLMEPTSPLRQPEDVEGAYRLLLKTGASSVVSCVESGGANPAFQFHLDRRFRMRCVGENFPNNLRRQDVAPTFFLDGTVYISSPQALENNRGFYHSDTVGYEIPRHRCFEVDDKYDFYIIESIMSRMLKDGHDIL